MSRAEAQSPETAPRRLLELAADYPDEVLNNEVLPLLAVENPSLFQTIVFRAQAERADRRLHQAVNQRSSAECWGPLRRLFQDELPRVEEPRLRDILEGTLIPLLAEAAQKEDDIRFRAALDGRRRMDRLLDVAVGPADAEVFSAMNETLDDLLEPGDASHSVKQALRSLQRAAKKRAAAARLPADEAYLAVVRAQLVAFGERP